MNEDYYFYKNQGICTTCHKRIPMYGVTTCDICSQKRSEKDVERYKKLKNSDKYAEYRKRKNEKERELRAKRRKAGVCTTCGKRSSYNGKLQCVDCLMSKRRKKDPRFNNSIKRNERAEYGLCYICAKTVKDGYKLCEEHYNRNISMGERYRNSLTKQISHPWRNTRRYNKKI